MGGARIGDLHDVFATRQGRPIHALNLVSALNLPQFISLAPFTTTFLIITCEQIKSGNMYCNAELRPSYFFSTLIQLGPRE